MDRGMKDYIQWGASAIWVQGIYPNLDESMITALVFIAKEGRESIHVMLSEWNEKLQTKEGKTNEV